jgi:hypothetical protein
MRRLCVIIYLLLCNPSVAQRLHLTSFQHELRWLDEMRFPPVVKDSTVSNLLLDYAAAKLSLKFDTEGYTRPEQVKYRLINMFGNPRLQSPPSSAKKEDYHAAVLSLITRGTTNNDVYWHLKVEVHHRGKIAYSRETSHQLLNYDAGIVWFTRNSFQEHFKILFEELLELSPALSKKYILGKGIDYAELLQTDGALWEVDRKSNQAGFGTPSFGPYITLDAGKLDTAEIRNKVKKRGDTEIGFSTDGLIFDQFQTIDFTRITFCFLLLESGKDTIRSTYYIRNHKSGTSRTFLSELLSGDDEYSPPESQFKHRSVTGSIQTDTITWAFSLQNLQNNGSLSGGYLTHSDAYYRLKITLRGTNRAAVIVTTQDGAYLASLSYNPSGAQMRMRKDIDTNTGNAIATLYAVLLSTKNVQ